MRAKIAILALFAALVRYFHLKWFLATPASLEPVEPFVIGSLVSAVGALVALAFYFVQKCRLTQITAIITVVALLALRFILL